MVGKARGSSRPDMPDKPPSDRVVLARIARSIARTNAIFGFAKLLLIPGTVLAAYPVANSLSGQSTEVDVKASLTIGVSLAVTNAATVVWAHRERRRRREVEARNKDLESDAKKHRHTGKN